MTICLESLSAVKRWHFLTQCSTRALHPCPTPDSSGRGPSVCSTCPNLCPAPCPDPCPAPGCCSSRPDPCPAPPLAAVAPGEETPCRRGHASVHRRHALSGHALCIEHTWHHASFHRVSMPSCAPPPDHCGDCLLWSAPSTDNYGNTISPNIPWTQGPLSALLVLPDILLVRAMEAIPAHCVCVCVCAMEAIPAHSHHASFIMPSSCIGVLSLPLIHSCSHYPHPPLVGVEQ